MFTMRFDMRAPSSGAPIGELYTAALEMAAWGEEHGCISVIAGSFRIIGIGCASIFDVSVSTNG